MPLIEIASLDDPRLAPYRHLKDTNLTRWSGLFVAEGEKLVRRLLASDYETASVLDADAEPLHRASRPARFALLFGSEGHGLDRSLVERCDRRLTIPIERGTDSLNACSPLRLPAMPDFSGESGKAPALQRGRPRCTTQVQLAICGMESRCIWAIQGK